MIINIAMMGTRIASTFFSDRNFLPFCLIDSERSVRIERLGFETVVVPSDDDEGERVRSTFFF